jgi:type I restriction enzyme S subunit
MKLRKDKWETVKLSEVCDKTSNVDIRKQSGKFNYIDIGSINSSAKRISEIQELDWAIASSRARQIVKKGDTLFSTVRVNLERIALVDKEIPNAIASTGFTVIRANEKAEPEFLFYSTSSPFFIAKLCKLQKGTAYPAVSDRIVFNEEIYLPSLDEQKQIASLFLSIEKAMEQVDSQEKKLKSLRKSLINKLTKQNPEFGNLLSESNCQEYTIGDLAVEVPDRTDNPQKSGIEKFIGLEDFESGELTIQKFSSTEKLVSAMKLCKQGDVLFARRNAYLKRASLAEFDAVCSGDVIVLRANDKNILPKFLILVMNTDEFWEFAISNAAGTMSKRVKWRDLATYSLELPNLKIQEKILEVFNQLETTLSQLKQQKTTLKNLKRKLLNEILG